MGYLLFVLVWRLWGCAMSETSALLKCAVCVGVRDVCRTPPTRKMGGCRGVDSLECLSPMRAGYGWFVILAVELGEKSSECAIVM